MGKVIALTKTTSKKVWVFAPWTVEHGNYKACNSIVETLADKCKELNYEIVGSTSIYGNQHMVYKGLCRLIEDLAENGCANTIYTLSLAFVFNTEFEFQRLENLLRHTGISLEGLDKIRLPRSAKEIENLDRLIREILWEDFTNNPKK